MSTKKKTKSAKSKAAPAATAKAAPAPAAKAKAPAAPAPRAAKITAKSALTRAVEYSKGKNKERMVLANTRVLPNVKTAAEEICKAKGTDLTSFMRETINQLVEQFGHTVASAAA